MRKSIKKWLIPLVALMVSASLLVGCGGPTPGTTTPTTSQTTTPTVPTTSAPTTTKPTTPTTTPPTSTVVLNGAGATFPAPLYTKWFDEYKKLTGVTINYQAVGSGSGITQITNGTVDFGASDGIMTTDQVTKAETANGPILHIPMTSGSVAVIYNLPGVTGIVTLTGDTLADIYLKKITKWNDPRIVAVNTKVLLPDIAIAVVHRSDGSGTTNIFTNYLKAVSSEWSTKVGAANSVNWPGDIGGQGNAGVAGQVQQIPGAIGYVELAYATQNKIAYATMQNVAGNFIAPSLASTTKASEGVTLPDDMKVMLINSSNPDAYPIVGFTWLLVYVNQKDKMIGDTLVKTLWWAIHDGQQFAEGLSYGKLSTTAVTKAENQILSIKFNGQPIMTR